MTQSTAQTPQQSKESITGKPLNRVDGRLKVTGAAHYAAEFPVEGVVHGVIISSTVPKGKITAIDTQAAEALPGVLGILTYENAPKLNLVPTFSGGGFSGEAMMPLQTPEVHYGGQHIGVVIAETLERATQAANLVQFTYEVDQPATQLEREKHQAFAPKTVFGKPATVTRGNPDAAFTEAEVQIDQTYTTPMENHNPMEPHATIAVWEDDNLTIYDATQYTYGVRQSIAMALEIPEEKIRVVCKFIGGAFGCKGTVWPHVVLSVMAARHVQRPVKLVLSRPQMFTGVGVRAQTQQQVKLGATAQGQLTSIIHQGISHTSAFDEYVEAFTIATHLLYACDNLEASQQLVRLNTVTPTFMRAPGESPGMYALESALDELAVALNLDPIELRLRNYAETDPHAQLPWSSKSLRECYQIGAEKFGWSERNSEPGSMKRGRYQIGMGMATATYPAYHFPATVKASLMPDGTLLMRSSTHDLGTGTATVMAQLAAEITGLPMEQIRFELGDTNFPKAPVSGGSATVGSVGTATHGAVHDLISKLIELIQADMESPLHQVPTEAIATADGRLFHTEDPSRGETYAAVMQRHHLSQLETEYTAQFGSEQKYSKHAFGAQFAEVQVDPDLGEVRLTRYVGAFAAGRILNRKTARSQLMGGIIMGIGMALEEETILDPHLGRIVNPNLAEYHVPVNADIPEIEICIIDEEDPHVNPIGTKGIGEIGITGVAAAVANAVYHATGKRIRELPITLDKLLG
ncbi:MAG: xanthine dehydrogenase family protein molybdopterin-binding subunit [Microcoleaceae cyanobacterium]